MQVLQDKTKRMTDLLSDWTMSSDNLKITAFIPHPQKIQYKVTGGSEIEAVMSLGLAQLINDKNFQTMINFDFREFDYFLRDTNSKPAFSNTHLEVFNRVKSHLCMAIVEYCMTLETEQHNLAYLNLKYHAALKNYCFKQEIQHDLIELVDIEPSLVVLKLREGLDNPHNKLDEISEHYANLFQDSEINVIPE